MYNIIGNIVGAVLAVVFVGFFAFKIGELPLTIIVIVFLAMMLYSFYDDMRNDQQIARHRKQKDRSG